jgi:hypothetical protein
VPDDQHVLFAAFPKRLPVSHDDTPNCCKSSEKAGKARPGKDHDMYADRKQDSEKRVEKDTEILLELSEKRKLPLAPQGNGATAVLLC